MTARKPTHPGAILLEDIIKPLNLSIAEAAKTPLTPDMAIHIAKATSTSPESWMSMQQKLTLWERKEENRHDS